MDIRTIEGIEIFVLPDNAVCLASDGKSPFDLYECPIGRCVCNPDDCINYDEPYKESDIE